MRRGDLQDAVMARKETVVRKAELCILASTNHEGVVLFKCEIASGLRTGYDMEGYTHSAINIYSRGIFREEFVPGSLINEHGQAINYYKQ